MLFLSAAFFCGLVLSLGFKLSPAAYARLRVLDEAPVPAKVNVNTASYDELQGVPGIGPSTAARIINYRQQKGRFASIEDLRRIPRFNARSFAKAALHLEVGLP